MRVVSRVSGNLSAVLDADADEISARLRGAIEVASKGLQEELRGQVRAGGLGPGLEKAWQREVYPKARRRTFRPAALVYSKSTILHEAFDVGPTITPRRNRFLVIPTEAGRRLGLGTVGSARGGGRVPASARRRYADLEPFADKIDAEIVSASTRGGGKSRRRRSGRAQGARIVLMRSRSGGFVAVLYARPGAQAVAVATLRPMVKLRKVLDIAGAEARADAALGAALSGF